MFFRIEHTTEYSYPEPATESFCELRLRPCTNAHQRVTRYSTRLDPSVPVETYTDCFDNFVEVVSIPFKHQKLTVTATCDVETNAPSDPLSGTELSVSESVHLNRPRLRELWDFLRPSGYVPINDETKQIAAEFFSPTADFATSIRRFNEHIFRNFKYEPGTTDVHTTVHGFLQKKAGVCQDFAHFMLAVCRSAKIPARYVSGYIETLPVGTPSNDSSDEALIGATASHAWVQIFTPAGLWVGFDPTNNMLESDRHIMIGCGRDYADIPPLKGVYKGARSQKLKVEVTVRRIETDYHGVEE